MAEMTRCLNCGAERDADVCDLCGLNSSAAEFLLRRKLLNRTAMFLLGALAFVVAAERYPALELDGILIFIGVLFFLTLGIGMWLERRALRHAEVEALKRVYYGLIPLPWLLSGLLLANGAFDTARPHTERTICPRKIRQARPGPHAAPHRHFVARRPPRRTRPRRPRRFRPLQLWRPRRSKSRRRPRRHPLGCGHLPPLKPYDRVSPALPLPTRPRKSPLAISRTENRQVRVPHPCAFQGWVFGARWNFIANRSTIRNQ